MKNLNRTTRLLNTNVVREQLLNGTLSIAYDISSNAECQVIDKLTKKLQPDLPSGCKWVNGVGKGNSTTVALQVHYDKNRDINYFNKL